MRRSLFMLLAALLFSVGGAHAQTFSHTPTDLTPLLGDVQGTYMALALAPQGQPAVAWRETGEQFGADRLQIRVFDGSAWLPIDAAPTLDPLNSQIAEQGFALASDPAGGLVLAINRVVGELGFDAFRTLVYRWDGTDWSPLGEPLGDSPAAGRLSLVPVNGDYVLAWYTENTLEVYWWDGSGWQAIGRDFGLSDSALNENARPLALSLAASPGGAFMALTQQLTSGEILFSLKQWNGETWRQQVELPVSNDFQIGLASLVGIASQPQTGFYVATAEQTTQASIYVSVWNLEPGGTWREYAPPTDAAESPCAQNHTIAAGDTGGLLYAWTADCRNRLNITRLEADGTWVSLGEPLTIGSVSSDRPVQLVSTRDDTIFVGWMETAGANQYSIHIGMYRPAG